MSGSVNVSIDPLPTAYTVAGGGAYCAGGAGLHVTLSSSDPGISYQLMNGGPVGAPIAGTGSPIDFGAQLAAGSYTVLATNTSTGCTNTMSSSATIIVNPLPTQFTVTGGGSYCTGSPSIHVGLSNSTIGVNYQLMNGFAPVGGAVAGTGSPLDFGVQAAAGFYTVVATDAVTGCTNTMTGGVAISILPLPNQYAVLGGGQFCAGGTGVDVSLSSSDFTTNYELYINAVASGNIQPGTGGAVDFGLQTAAGNYTVVATNTVTTCVNNMTGSVNVIVNPLPTAFNVGGSGSYCAGGAGISVTLSSSNVGTDYQLYYGIVAIGAPMAGTGAMLTFPAQTNPGTYTITATITATGCTAPMTGSATITVDPLPIIYNVTGGGHYCAGGAGVNVGLSSSEVGVNYQLFNGGFPVGGPLAGTGSALSFGLQLSGGTYTIVATNATTGCSSVMFGSAVVVVDALPIVFNMNPGGAYCAGGPGIDLTLTGSEIGVSYQLWVGGFPVGSAVAGTGSPLDLGFQTMAGTYTCVATNTTTGCTSNMALSATVVVNPLPAPYNLSAGGHYCAGGPGIDITLSGSDLGIGYQLFVDGIPVGGLVSGTGSPLDFGFQTTGGTYTIIATDLTTFCTNNMSGTPVIVVDPLPVAFAMSAGGSYCAGGPGLNVTLSGSEVGVNYEIYLGGVPTGTIIPGTGSALNMTLTAGVYTIIATNATTGCMNTMLGSTVITVDPLPTAILGPTNVCVSSFITLSDATSGGLWSSSDVSIATIDPVTGLVSGLSAGTFNVTYTLTATGCFIAVTDTVNALPVVGVISGASTLCQNYTTLFTNPTPGGVWSSADMSVATVDLAGNVFGVAAGTTTISYTVTTPFGCTTTVGSTDLTVIASPVVSAITGSMTNMCAGISATLADATPGGVWSSSDASVATVSGSGVVTGMSFGSVTISYSVTNLSGCTTSATYGFSIGNAMPPLATLPTTSATVCHGAPVNLSAVTSGSGLTYQWNLGGSPVPGATDANYSTTAIGTYNVTVDNGTCHVEIGSINVVPSPVAVISYDSVAGLLYTGSFSSYQWYFDSVAIPGAVSYSTPPNYGGEYNVVVTDINGCSDTADVPYIFDGPTPPNVVKHIVRNADDIKVYPNPVSNVLYIDAPQRVFVTVLTMDGKMLLAQKEAISVNVGQLANGTYMIMIYDENNMLLKAEKFIKNGQ